MAKSAADRRRTKRVAMEKARGELVVSLESHVMDISVAGMAIETNSRLAPRQRITFHLDRGEGSVSLAGRVVWCFLQGVRNLENGEPVPLYRAGVEFENVLSPEAHELLRFLERHAIVTVETRLFGRFHVEDSAQVDVRSSAEFRVLELGPERTTVESRLALDPASECDLELTIDGATLPARARVLERRSVAGDNGRFVIDLELLDLSEGAREALRRLMGEAPPAKHVSGARR